MSSSHNLAHRTPSRSAAESSERIGGVVASHAFPLQFLRSELPTSSNSFLGRLRRKLGALIGRLLLKDYLLAEQTFTLRVVEYLSALEETSRVGFMTEIRVRLSSLEQNMSQLAVQLAANLSATETRVANAARNELTELQNGMSELNRQMTRLGEVENIIAGIERLINRAGPTLTSTSTPPNIPPEAQTAALLAHDSSYYLFENRFRGSEAMIEERLRGYISLFSETDEPVLEIGSGRGELQHLFRSTGIRSYGLELNPQMEQYAREQGLDVRNEEALAHLVTLPDASLGGLIAIHVIEHLSRDALAQFLRLARNKIRRGGRLILETPNVTSLVTLAQNYFRDPTHLLPLHPETFKFMVNVAGFRILEHRELSPFPEGALLREIPTAAYMTPQWIQTLELFNANVRELNRLLFGAQDYAIIAEVTDE